MKKAALKKSLKESVSWFKKSGIMDPPDGSWGVAERIALADGNEALKTIFERFPSYVESEGHAVVEHRRPDCNFQTAFLFLLAAKALGEEKLEGTSEKILRYLYRRSGMQNKERTSECPAFAWKWENGQWGAGAPYFDDNAWNCVIPLILARLRPDLDGRFSLRSSALTLASEMERGFASHFPKPSSGIAPKDKWQGDLASPHWGALAMMTFAFAYAETGETKYLDAIKKYEAYLAKSAESFTTSECAYALIGCSSVAALGEKSALDIARLYAEKLLSKMDPKTGRLASEWGKEAPTGESLVDLIYTQNWALLGLLSFRSIASDKRIDDAFEKTLELIVSLQDSSKEPHLKGCWRGMYDMAAGRWGGGDRFEGGANSVYSGWTNAPIGIALASTLLGISPLTDFARSKGK